MQIQLTSQEMLEKPRNSDASDEQVRRDLEKLGKLLGMYFADGAFRVHYVNIS